MSTIFFSPWWANGRSGPARVSAIKIAARHQWDTYAAYPYTHGVDAKLSHIPQHQWGDGKTREGLFRLPRLVHFCDSTGCRPNPPGRRAGIPRSHHPIKTINRCDHTTYWLGPNGEPLILTEPYNPSQEEIEAEFIQRNLTAIVLPAPGIYAGGYNWSKSVLMGLPEDQGLLDAISIQLNETGWPDTGVVREMSFEEALKLSKQQAREVRFYPDECHHDE